MNAKLYRVYGDTTQYPPIVFSDPDHETIDILNAIDRGTVAKIPRIEISSEDSPFDESRLSDCPMLMNKYLVVSERAYQALIVLIRAHCDIYPVRIQDLEYYFIKPRTIIDILDLDKSEIDYLNNKIVYVNNFVFKGASNPDEVSIFRVKGAEKLGIFTTETFVQTVKSSNLKGFVFEAVDVS